jgi:adenine-specific DNA-methyltransferase
MPAKVEVLDNNIRKVTIGIERYVLFDYPIEDDKKREEIMEIVQKDNFALVDYWAVDWNYDGFTFKSTWQAFRGFGRQIQRIPKSVSKEMKEQSKLTIAVRLVDIFGNDASATQVVDLRRR